MIIMNNNNDEVSQALNEVIKALNQSIEQQKEEQQKQKVLEEFSIFKDQPINKQLSILQVFLFRTRCELYSLAEQYKIKCAELNALKKGLNRKFNDQQKQINEIVDFCNGLKIVGYEDEYGNIIEEEDDKDDD